MRPLFWVTDDWQLSQWSSYISAIFCWESLDPSIRADASWHKLSTQTRLQAKHSNLKAHLNSTRLSVEMNRVVDFSHRWVELRYLVRANIRTHPVVQVVVKGHVTDAELELLQETMVTHHIKGREDITSSLSARKKRPFIIHRSHQIALKILSLKLKTLGTF